MKTRSQEELRKSQEESESSQPTIHFGSQFSSNDSQLPLQNKEQPWINAIANLHSAFPPSKDIQIRILTLTKSLFEDCINLNIPVDVLATKISGANPGNFKKDQKAIFNEAADSLVELKISYSNASDEKKSNIKNTIDETLEAIDRKKLMQKNYQTQ